MIRALYLLAMVLAFAAGKALPREARMYGTLHTVNAELGRYALALGNDTNSPQTILFAVPTDVALAAWLDAHDRKQVALVFHEWGGPTVDGQ